MTNLDKWEAIISYARRHGLAYVSYVAVRDNEIRYRSHYPTMFDPELLRIIYGDIWREEGIKLLKLALDGGNTIGKLYEDYVALANQPLPDEQGSDTVG